MRMSQPLSYQEGKGYETPIKRKQIRMKKCQVRNCDAESVAEHTIKLPPDPRGGGLEEIVNHIKLVQLCHAHSTALKKGITL